MSRFLKKAFGHGSKEDTVDSFQRFNSTSFEVREGKEY